MDWRGVGLFLFLISMVCILNGDVLLMLCFGELFINMIFFGFRLDFFKLILKKWLWGLYDLVVFELV